MPKQEQTTGASEADNNTLNSIYLAIQECERRGIENERIARVLVQSTPNHRQIAEIMLTLVAIPIKGDIVNGKLKWRE